jgi:2-polyprenyl-3-methyl-5-hydroxy-6-metoxy-1,4-benzoquinol methylase
MKRYKEANIPDKLSSQAFAITDNTYGVTAALDQCASCGFIQSNDISQVVSYYETLEDPAYEANRKERSLQAYKILDQVQKYVEKGSMLDIGAGSGMLVEQAIKRGYKAVGVEPSVWLTSKAKEYKLPVVLGIFPHPEIKDKFDVITLVDVIEHVDNPVQLFKDMYDALLPGGYVVVVTPDIGSMVARILGKKWWHFRVAHIGYFNTKTLDLALKKTGFKMQKIQRAKWYFAADYLIQRVYAYVPKILRLPIPRFLTKVTVPLNLGDSMLAIYKKD